MSFNLRELLKEFNCGEGQYLDVSNMYLTGKLVISCPPEQRDTILNSVVSQLKIEQITQLKIEPIQKKRRRKRNKKKKKQIE